MPRIALVLLFFLLCTPAIAADHFVFPDGSGVYATIGEALDNITPGDTIWLMQGTFKGPGNTDLLIQQDVTIRGNTNDRECIIDLEGADDEFHFGFRCENASVTLRNLAIINGYANNGAAMSIEEGYVQVQGCRFAHNEADRRGGAIYVSEEAIAVFTECRFGANYAADEGGAVFGAGAAEIQLTLCSLVANGADEGSAVYLHSSATCDIERSILSFGHGGAACQYQSTNHFTAMCTDVFGNTGGDWVEGLAGLDGTNNNISADPLFCDPLGPTANYRLTYHSPCGTPNACSIIGADGQDVDWFDPVYTLKANGRGMTRTIAEAMAIAPSGAVIALDNGTYTGDGNRDLDFGAKDFVLCSRSGNPEYCVLDVGASYGDDHRALVMLDGQTETTRVEGLTFRNARSWHGGAVYMVHPVGPRFLTCIFEDCYAQYGGAVFMQGATGQPNATRFQDCVFSDNTSTQQGGAICALRWDLNLQDCLFERNESTDGGAVYVTVASGQIRNCDFNNNIGHDVLGKGGAAYLLQTQSPELDPLQFLSCNFQQNTATHGGGLWMARSLENACLDVLLTECNFYENESTECGGALEINGYTTTDDYVTLENCQIHNNTSKMAGGAYLKSLEATLSETTFIGNNAWHTEAGALLIFDAPSSHLVECRFEDNSAGDEGGALSLISSDYTQIRDCGFIGNQSGFKGGALKAENAYTYVTQSSFKDNSAQQSGGAIMFICEMVNTSLQLDECLLSGNTANTMAGALYTVSENGHDANVTINQSTFHNNGTDDLEGAALYANNADVSLNLSYCLMTMNSGSSLIHCGNETGANTSVMCSNFFANDGGDWTGPLAALANQDDNMSEFPMYCNPAAGDLRLNEASPCLPDNNACDTQIGARGQGCTGTVAVPHAATAHLSAVLHGNYPNPFNPSTTVVFELPRSAPVCLEVYDTGGRLVRVLQNAEMHTVGQHEVIWNGFDQQGRPVGSGVYFARLRVDGQTAVQRMLMLK